MIKTSNCLILATIVSLGLSGCGEKKDTTAKTAVNALIVNGKPISVAELDSKAGHAQGKNEHAISEPKLKQLIDMELLRQAAVQDKLDGDENVRAKIANATRSILAMAYMEQQLAKIGTPTDAEVEAYFNQNPARFAERKEYQLHEFSIQAPIGKDAEIRSQLAQRKNPEESEQWLKTNNIPHNSAPITVTSDKLNDEVLLKLKNVSVGGQITLGDKQQINVLYVLAEQKKPLELNAVRQALPKLIIEKRKQETIDTSLKQAHDKAKVEYLPPYTEAGYLPPVKNKE